MIELTLPWPPSINNYWRSRAVGRKVYTYTTAEAKRYRKNVAGLCLAQGVRQPLMGRISIDIAACPPDLRKRDLDNVLKALLDALTAGRVWVDDSQIDELTIKREPRRFMGGIMVLIREVGNE